MDSQSFRIENRGQRNAQPKSSETKKQSPQFFSYYHDSRGGLPKWVHMVARWNSRLLCDFGLHHHMVASPADRRVEREPDIRSALSTDSELTTDCVDRILEEKLINNFFNPGPNPDHFEFHSFRRFLVARNLSLVHSSASVFHIDADLILSRSFAESLLQFWSAGAAENLDACSPEMNYTPLLYLSGAGTSLFAEYISSYYWTEQDLGNVKGRVCDMSALEHAVTTKHLSWSRMDLFPLGFVPTFSAEIEAIYGGVKGHSDLWKEPDFRSAVAAKLSQRDGDFYFSGKYLPFIHFQGWTKVFISPRLLGELS